MKASVASTMSASCPQKPCGERPSQASGPLTGPCPPLISCVRAEAPMRCATRSWPLGGERGQHGFEHHGQQAEGFDAGGAHVVQTCIHAFLFGQFPRFVLVYIGIHTIR